MSAVRSPLPLLAASALLSAACGGSASLPTTTETEPQACSIPTSCATPVPECLGLADNAGQSRFGLRVAQLDVTRPAGTLLGLVGVIVAADVLPSDVACDLPGTGTFSWILRFDTSAGTLETGGALPPADPGEGYAFVDQEIAGFHVQPVTFAVDLGADGSFSTPVAQDLTLPMYTDRGATQLPVLLPLRGVRFIAGALGSGQSCIGRYDPAALDPASDCYPGDGGSAFLDGAAVTGVIALEDAERVSLPAFSETLCARLAGEGAAVTARDAAGVLHCRRDVAGAIVFAGDACSTPGGTCADAVAIAAGFAASSVRIGD
jgi:hypothetical protein